ncbi:Alpha beta hydrolase fold protein [Lasiodiplodia theobromae]|uniref:Alpha beta hydrolase fold protein n=1 Tax=Lasiodiplodia theobromae TaxID=45133 RepID=UPI0015C37323|nr:Alpha beta hydrolase fold protein [Lasiodiplodia theobromae]KAF4542094.1 Alpha beta hydrolase fold protein [Lasiodiplodia theobromae]
MLFAQDAFASILKPQFFSTPASLNASSPPLSADLEGRLSPLISRLLALIGVDPARPLSVSDMAKISLICGLIPGLLLHRHRSQKKGDDNSSLSDTIGQDAVATDPGLLKKHSTYKSYTVTSTGWTYPSIRTFYRPHPQGDKLPKKPAPLPLLVFVHGLGGCAAQFQSLLTSLVNLAPCLAIDFPGCGLSEFAPKNPRAYHANALAALLATVVDEHRDKEAGQGVIFIGHSLGCSISAYLASSSSPEAHHLSDHVLGFIAICPKAEPPTEEEAAKFRKLLSIPNPIFDLWRRWDRRGGTESASVRRFVGPDADEETKKLQVRFNKQSRTPVWKSIVAKKEEGMPGKDIWAGLNMPIFLVAGEADPITPPNELRKIASFLGKDVGLAGEKGPEAIVDTAAPVDLTSANGSPRTYRTGSETLLDSLDSDSLPPLDVSITTDGEASVSLRPKAKCLKTAILPSPASHALLYAPATARTLAGLIQGFLADRVDKRLSLGWQLKYLTTEGKWDVKNLKKWQAVTPVSEPIAGVFRAMKTLREVDPTHCPRVFVKDWQGKIRAVVDISHESPVYDPKGLENGGIQYHKFPTVSKLPPTEDEVKQFITMIDRLRGENSSVPSEEASTGFFIVCYLVERLGWTLQNAINEFAKKRSPGIRHEHFIDTLFVRYHVGLKRAPTL